MNCWRARRAITETRLRVLPRRAAAALERHLESCPTCREDARFEAALAAGLAELRATGPEPLDLADAIAARVRSRGAVPGPTRPGLPVSAAGTAGLVAVVLTVAAAAWLASRATAAGAAAVRPLAREIATALAAALAWIPEFLTALGSVALDLVAAAGTLAARHEGALSLAGIATACGVLAASLVVVVVEVLRSPRFVSKEMR